MHAVPQDRVDLLTGRSMPAGRGIALAELLTDYPVALLVPAHVAEATDHGTETHADSGATADSGSGSADESDAQAEIDILEGHA